MSQSPADFVTPATSAGYRFTLRVRIDKAAGTLGALTQAILDEEGGIGAIDLVQPGRDRETRDVTVDAVDERHQHRIVEAARQMAGIRVMSVSDRTFLMHLGGKLEVISKRPIETRDDLSMVYTPGVARVSRAIYEDRACVHRLTVKGNMVGIVTDGSAVLGLGNVGPEAALPVMEGKAALFKEFADVDAFPICLSTQKVDEIVETVKRIEPVFGAINLEDIAAPGCMEVEDRLRQELDIPVFHDDQHGTAIVVAAALINAAKLVGKQLAAMKVVVSGVGAAGLASTKMLLRLGVRDIVGCDRAGAIYQGRTIGMNPMKQWYALNTNPERRKGSLSDVIAGADLFLGLSAPALLKANDVKRMAKNSIVFALANPVPEIMPEEAAVFAAVVATGRSDYPNQVNNVLAFPGVFRGALDCRASTIHEEMNMAAARAIAGLVADDELNAEYIIPSVFDRRVAHAVAEAVAATAEQSGVARRERPHRAMAGITPPTPWDQTAKLGC